MKKIIIVVAISILVGVGAFFGGMKYAESKNSGNSGRGNFQNLAGLSSQERQQRLEEMGTNGNFGSRGVGQGGGFISGEILSKDDQSLTVKMPDGGSKIIFYSETTQISKFTDGDAEDMVVGKNITVSGSANQDGSITANTIQTRPQIFLPQDDK